jgi:hypothetical protein
MGLRGRIWMGDLAWGAWLGLACLGGLFGLASVRLDRLAGWTGMGWCFGVVWLGSFDLGTYSTTTLCLLLTTLRGA